LQRTYPFLIAAIVIVAIGAPIAQGTGRADPVAALTLKVKALQTRVASLEAKASETSNALAGAKNDIATVNSSLGTTQQGVASLQSGASALQTAVANVQSSVACVRYGTLPIKRYTGYMYTNNAGVTIGVTTALDVVEAGQTPGGYVALVNPSCVGAAFALRQAMEPAVTR
jgi:hypothetical protein